MQRQKIPSVVNRIKTVIVLQIKIKPSAKSSSGINESQRVIFQNTCHLLKYPQGNPETSARTPNDS